MDQGSANKLGVMDSLMKMLLERLRELEMRTAKLEAEVEHLKFLLREITVKQ